MKRNEKLTAVETLREELGDDGHFVLAEYRGLTVEQLTELRRKVRAASGRVKIVKNTLVRRAFAGTDREVVGDLLQGPNALVFTRKDPVPVVKALTDAARGFETLKVKGGMVEGRRVSPEQLLMIAELPSREVLLGKAFGSMMAPLQGLVNVCQGTLRNLVYVLEAVRQAKASGA